MGYLIQPDGRDRLSTSDETGSISRLRPVLEMESTTKKRRRRCSVVGLWRDFGMGLTVRWNGLWSIINIQKIKADSVFAGEGAESHLSSPPFHSIMVLAEYCSLLASRLCVYDEGASLRWSKCKSPLFMKTVKKNIVSCSSSYPLALSVGFVSVLLDWSWIRDASHWSALEPSSVDDHLFDKSCRFLRSDTRVNLSYPMKLMDQSEFSG